MLINTAMETATTVHDRKRLVGGLLAVAAAAIVLCILVFGRGRSPPPGQLLYVPAAATLAPTAPGSGALAHLEQACRAAGFVPPA